ncbi:GGDEF domain-containing protein [Vibrio sp. SS-MA-C1-2]|uniref:GGDEF domain-containing protein n=1 Tax=Vibrio sp. SS-MA-C1-2 TaxID=2908646 RepID=UPI001F38BF8E|nr:GGDEF domain-containing protein [Vibrio sp. SS-MA-C1-2]UJF17784.1 GGDEF domain-containing protein [Vibrio sp. SS-MA-C1-2]
MKITDQALTTQQNITQVELNERLSLFDLSNSDIDKLRRYSTIVTHQVDTIIDLFYEKQTQIPDIENLIGDLGTLRRLKSAIRQYIIEIFTAEIDLDYVESRLRIGLVHKRIGVEPKFFLSAVYYLQLNINKAISDQIEDKSIVEEITGILNRLIEFDVSYIFDTYIKSIMNEIQIEKDRSVKHAENLEAKIKRKTERYKELSLIDPLTQVYNKRAFNELAKETFIEAEHLGESLSLIYIDIDKFKQTNDQLGHDEGDNVLIVLADSLRKVSRRDDLIFRLGGDEFAVILNNSNTKNVLESYIPRLMTKIESTGKPLSISLGHYQVGPDEYLAPAQALKLADQEMYKVKRSRTTEGNETELINREKTPYT